MHKYIRLIVYLLLLLLPISCNLIEHAGSTILWIFTFLGMYLCLTRETFPSFDYKEKIIMWIFALYFFVCFFLFCANNLLNEYFSFTWELNNEMRMLTFIPIYFLFKKAKLNTSVLWYGVSAGAIIYGIYALVYAYGLSGNPRVAGTYGPIAFGDISLVLSFISITGIRKFQTDHKVLIIIPILAFAGGIMASFLSGTRGAVIAIPFLVFIFFIQLGTFKSPWLYRNIFILTIIVLSVSYYHLPGNWFDIRIRSSVTKAKLFFHDSNAGFIDVRLSMWTEGWKMFLEHPFCGIGPEGYRKTIQQKAADNQIPHQIEGFKTPHNMYLTKMVAYGIFGMLMLFAVFLSPLFVLIQAVKTKGLASDIAYAGIMLIVSFMLFAMTESIFYRNINTNFYIIMLAAILSLIKFYKKPGN